MSDLDLDRLEALAEKPADAISAEEWASRTRTGTCSNPKCPLTRAHSGPCDIYRDPTDARIEAVARVIANSALDWVDIESGEHTHSTDCANWEAWTGDATNALSAVGVPALIARVRELEAELANARGGWDSALRIVNSGSEIISQVGAERDAALSTIAKVEALHRPFEWSFGFGPVTSCKGCADQGVPQENASWPCPTIRALGSVPSTGEGNE